MFVSSDDIHAKFEDENSWFAMKPNPDTDFVQYQIGNMLKFNPLVYNLVSVFLYQPAWVI